jgi:hypothetical protein
MKLYLYLCNVIIITPNLNEWTFCSAPYSKSPDILKPFKNCHSILYKYCNVKNKLKELKYIL